jgi:uncharacterized protein YciI
MNSEKQHFLLKLLPPRPTFQQDMSDDERNIMIKHTEYLKDLMDKGIALVYGPVFDPKGAYGMGIVQADNEEQVKIITANDPASQLGKYEVFLMRAVTPNK